MAEIKTDKLIYDWNEKLELSNFKGFVDETIRDGFQLIQLIDTNKETKKDIISYMNNINLISDVVVGMIGISEKNDQDIGGLLNHIDTDKLTPWILCRLNLDDVKKVENYIPKGVGINLFIAISDIRLYVENWDYETVLNNLVDIVKYCKRKFKYIRVAIEDSTRATEKKLIYAIQKLVELEVDRLTIADTVGIATPTGVENIFSAIHQAFPQFNSLKTKFEWHGHNDRGLAVASSLKSIECGASYVHGTILGIGERNGNANIDILMCNLYDNFRDENWEIIKDYYSYCWEHFSSLLNYIYPYYGENSNKSSTGTHCSAIIKALKKGDKETAKKVFSISSPYLDNNLIDRMVLSRISGRNMMSYILESKGINLNDSEKNKAFDYLKKNETLLNVDEFIQKIRAKN